MLLSARVGPSLAKYAQLRYASYHPLLLKAVVCKNPPMYSTLGREQTKDNILTGENTIHSSVRQSDISTLRWYSTQPSLPSKSELEKGFFKILVVVWDLCAKIIAWSLSMFQSRVLGHPTVQAKWKEFNQKLEEARKG